MVQPPDVKFLIFDEEILEPMQSLVHLVILLVLTVAEKSSQACLHFGFVLREVSEHLEQAS